MHTPEFTGHAVKLAFDLGYRVVEGKVFSRLGKQRKLRLAGGYFYFTVKDPGVRSNSLVRVHRLAAYQKFGMVMFKPGILVRHRDSVRTNNLPDNILLGTPSDNMFDQPEEVRQRKSAAAGRVHSDETVALVKRERARGTSFNALIKITGIKSKGTLHYMANANYLTKL